MTGPGPFFAGWPITFAEVAGVRFRLRTGGDGPPILLLHGHPQTHAMWHAVAPQLGRHHVVIAPDLPGYGHSDVPARAATSGPCSKRLVAAELVELMAQLGHERFAVVGHDRGARVAYRMALDHPDRVTHLAVLDIVPTADVWRFAEREGKRFGAAYWHWYFLAQPYDLPERLIGAAPAKFYLASGGPEFHPQALADYRRCTARPETIHAMCEDYRAGAGVDDELDEHDRRTGRRIGCPVLALWSAEGEIEEWFDVLDVWRSWAHDVRGHAVDAGHFLAEAVPSEVASAVRDLLRA